MAAPSWDDMVQYPGTLWVSDPWRFESLERTLTFWLRHRLDYGEWPGGWVPVDELKDVECMYKKRAKGWEIYEVGAHSHAPNPNATHMRFEVYWEYDDDDTFIDAHIRLHPECREKYRHQRR